MVGTAEESEGRKEFMTDDQIRIAIAEACGANDRWAIMKHGLYYRPHAKGYTNKVSEAWIVSEAEADKHVYPHDEPVTKHRALLPDYLNDLNAIHEAEVTLQGGQRALFAGAMHRVIVALGKTGIDGEFAAIHATARQRCEAFLRVKGLWQEGI